MNRLQALEGSPSKDLFEEIQLLQQSLDQAFQRQFNRSLPFNESLFDRWERAKQLHFGPGTSIYDNSFVFGDVQVGENTWIGPFTILDGSGGLFIGKSCTIAAGVHIYSHDNVAQTLTGGQAAIERKPVSIGDNTYIGPNAVIAKGVRIGNKCIVGVGSYVNQDVADNMVVVGTPAKAIGTTQVKDGQLTIAYFHQKS